MAQCAIISISLKDVILACVYQKVATLNHYSDSIELKPEESYTFEFPIEPFKSKYINPVVIPLSLQISPEISDAVTLTLKYDEITLIKDNNTPTQVYDRPINMLDFTPIYVVKNKLTITLNNKLSNTTVPVRLTLMTCVMNNDKWNELIDAYYGVIYDFMFPRR